MKPIFSRSCSFQLRFFLIAIVAIATIFADSKLEIFVKIRTYMDMAITPIYFLVDGPRQIFDNISQILTTHIQLALENRKLRKELFLKNSDQLLLDQYKKENAHLRELLGSPLRKNEHKMITRTISTNTDLYSDHIIIDKGLNHGVYVGQPVISDKGVVGQVTATNKFTSRVMLICGTSHALPIQVLRNNIRVIIAGNGCNKDLKLEHLPGNTDIRVGDVLVTSGLGGRFPEGYPVAVVSSVKVDTKRAYTIIHARPSAGFQHLNYLLLLWNANMRSELPLPPDKVHRVANERLIKMMSQVLSPSDNITQLPLDKNISKPKLNKMATKSTDSNKIVLGMEIHNNEPVLSP
ncbi:Cell shape-determining protein MreC [Candidatus Gullanella endobia]|uniref:Cell shape-determining protein MreC n=1 Tax=Candidatus Gullanella endobia TaxID=1070130 RepID=A0A143WRJ3_9ENTR|nr:rod shape-determining protein MreC [Candidatus Gullanella endobia]CUX96147.1 Cell shape-determining protein MreC [Candidatus Gullanella endobia]